MCFKKQIFIAGFLIFIIGVFYIATIREGHDWGDDFSQYIHHAKNLAEGIDYSDTGYIYNPMNPALPKTYPPVFPLLLAPVYKCFGLNFKAMKIEIIMTFMGFLFVLFLLLRNELPFIYVFFIIAIIGFHPWFWDCKDGVLSDIPFLLFTYSSLFFINLAYDPKKSKQTQIIYAALSGFFVYLAFGTRDIGFVLLPCLIIYDTLKLKKLSLKAIMSIVFFAFFVGLQYVLLHPSSSYFDQYNVSYNDFYKIVVFNIKWYRNMLFYIWNSGYSNTFNNTLSRIFYILAIVGYIAIIKKRISTPDIFFMGYTTAIFFWISFDPRYLFPVMPLFVFYGFFGIKQIAYFKWQGVEQAAFILIIAAIFLSYAGMYKKMDFGPLLEGMGKKETRELFAYIREHTDKGKIFIFVQPRALSLFTERSASTYHIPQYPVTHPAYLREKSFQSFQMTAEDDLSLLRYFQKIHAAYVITSTKTVSFNFAYDQKILRPLIERHKEQFHEVFSNADFTVYRIK